MGPGAPSADTQCGIIGGSARYAVGVCGFNSEAGSARYQLQGGQGGPPCAVFPALVRLSCPCPVLMPSALHCGFSAPVSATLVVRTLSKIAARASGRRRGPAAPSAGAGADIHQRRAQRGSPGRATRKQGAGTKTSGRKRQGGGSATSGQSPPAPCFLGSAPRRRGREPKLPIDHHQQFTAGGEAAEQARGRKSRQGGNGTRGPTGRGGPLAPPCGIFFAFLGGCGHPPPRIAARGPTRARSGATTAAPPLCGEGGKPGPRRTRHRRPEGALYHGAKGGGPRTGPLRAPRPGRGGTPTDTLSSLATAEAAPGAVWSEAEFGPNGTTEPTPARIVRARAEGTRRRGCGGPPPRASRPEPPRRGERGSASDSPLVMLLRSST